MKILFNCSYPFALAHGGQQLQIESTRSAMQSLGLEVEPFRWWDDKQSGDIIHYFGRIPSMQIELAHRKGIKVVMAELLGSTGSRSRGTLWMQHVVTGIMRRTLPDSRLAAFNWKSYRLADACVALTPWEGHLMSHIFGASPEKVHVVPNGVEELFLNSPRVERGQWLVCTATITKVKRVVEVAEAAIRAQTPLWIIGKAYSDSDPYAQKFFALAGKHPQFVRYNGPVQDRQQLARIYREARGFIMLSAWESLSLSALEAAACECQLLLSDLPWARSTFGERASYCPIAPPERTAGYLRTFYDQAPSLKPPPKPLTWIEVAQQLGRIYSAVLGRKS
jgi:glycosyltransferase involved in cell wall biosynthesis